MKRRSHSFVLAVGLVPAAIGVGPAPATAQLETIPFVYAPPPGPQRGLVTATGLAARGVNDDSGEFWAFAVRGEIGVTDAVSIAGSVGTLRQLVAADDGSLKIQGSVDAAVRVLRRVSPDGSGSTSVSLVGGLAYVPVFGGGSSVNVPLGVGIARVFELGGLAVEAWGTPRLMASRFAQSGEAVTQYGGAVSAGGTIGFSLGAALVLAADYRSLGEAGSGELTAPARSPLSVGIGLRFRTARWP